MGLDGYAERLVRHWARRLVRELRLPAADLPDVEQELWLGLVARWPRYDAQRASPRTFAARVVERRAATLRQRLRTASRRRTRRLPAEGSDPGYDNEAPACDDRPGKTRGPAPEANDVISRVEEPGLADDVTTVLAKLPDALRELCQRLMVEDVSKVARHMGVSRAAIYRRIQVARASFAAAEVQEYL